VVPNDRLTVNPPIPQLTWAYAAGLDGVRNERS
jgi:hypothetical protein